MRKLDRSPAQSSVSAQSDAQSRSSLRDRILQSKRFQAGAIALLSGLLMGLAPAPVNAWGLAWVALAPLWVLLADRASGRGLWLIAGLWGLVYHGMSLSWITGLHPLTWMGIPWLASVAIVGLIWLIITLWGVGTVVLWGWGLAWMQRRQLHPGLRILLGGALWCVLETLRNQSALDWTTLAYTQSPGNLIGLHLDQLSGTSTLTAAIVAVNGFLAEAWLARRSIVGKRFATGAIGLFLGVHLVGWILYSQPLNDSPSQALRVGLIQGNIPTRIKLFAQGLQQSLQHYPLGYRLLAAQGADLVVTPEAAMPFTWDWTPDPANPMQAAVDELKVPLVLGAFGKRGDRTTQSLMMLDRQGRVESQYDKIKVVPLGEALPFEEILGKVIGRLSPIKSYLKAGSPQQRFVTPFGNVAVGICYESAFPELFRDQVVGGAQFLLTASNLDPYSTVLMAQHQAHNLMRAIESDRWMINVTNTGYSSIITPHGQVLWQSQPHRYATYLATLYRRQTQTLYDRWGNWLTVVLSGVGLVILIGSRGVGRGLSRS